MESVPNITESDYPKSIDLISYGISPDDRSYDSMVINAGGDSLMFECLIALRDIDTAFYNQRLTFDAWSKHTIAIHSQVQARKEEFSKGN